MTDRKFAAIKVLDDTSVSASQGALVSLALSQALDELRTVGTIDWSTLRVVFSAPEVPIEGYEGMMRLKVTARGSNP